MTQAKESLAIPQSVVKLCTRCRDYYLGEISIFGGDCPSCDAPLIKVGLYDPSKPLPPGTMHVKVRMTTGPSGIITKITDKDGRPV